MKKQSSGKGSFNDFKNSGSENFNKGNNGFNDNEPNSPSFKKIAMLSGFLVLAIVAVIFGFKLWNDMATKKNANIKTLPTEQRGGTLTSEEKKTLESDKQKAIELNKDVRTKAEQEDREAIIAKFKTEEELNEFLAADAGNTRNRKTSAEMNNDMLTKYAISQTENDLNKAYNSIVVCLERGDDPSKYSKVLTEFISKGYSPLIAIYEVQNDYIQFCSLPNLLYTEEYGESPNGSGDQAGVEVDGTARAYIIARGKREVVYLNDSKMTLEQWLAEKVKEY